MSEAFPNRTKAKIKLQFPSNESGIANASLWFTKNFGKFPALQSQDEDLFAALKTRADEHQNTVNLLIQSLSLSLILSNIEISRTQNLSIPLVESASESSVLMKQTILNYYDLVEETNGLLPFHLFVTGYNNPQRNSPPTSIDEAHFIPMYFSIKKDAGPLIVLRQPKLGEFLSVIEKINPNSINIEDELRKSK